MLKRHVFNRLKEWKVSEDRKPLILRGARQVGKTVLARRLGKNFEYFVEINFEKDGGFRNLFAPDLDPQRIVRDISLQIQTSIIPGKTLLFLDEINECPNAIKALRYFYEELPQLHVLAAGSLLDFAFEEVGVPVGRVQFINIYPMSFMEFLDAVGNDRLREEIEGSSLTTALSDHLHEYTLKKLREYLAVGGMPHAVQQWVQKNDLNLCQREHRLIVDGYIQDFSKYAKKHQIKYCELVFKNLGGMLGHKIVYREISTDHRARELRPTFDLLEKARVIHKISHSSGNGIPLGGEANADKFKAILSDVALTQTLLGLDKGEWILNPHIDFVNKGGIIEAFVGQELLAYSNPFEDTQLYYWHREERGSQSEVDYLFPVEHQVVPIEVKSGKHIRIKSLRKFLDEKKKSPFGLFLSEHNSESLQNILIIPLYKVANVLTGANISSGIHAH